jgi:hypothetical protein
MPKRIIFLQLLISALLSLAASEGISAYNPKREIIPKIDIESHIAVDTSHDFKQSILRNHTNFFADWPYPSPAILDGNNISPENNRVAVRVVNVGLGTRTAYSAIKDAYRFCLALSRGDLICAIHRGISFGLNLLASGRHFLSCAEFAIPRRRPNIWNTLCLTGVGQASSLARDMVDSTSNKESLQDVIKRLENLMEDLKPSSTLRSFSLK